MRCNLIVETNEIAVRDYSIAEDEGLIVLVSRWPYLSFSYEDDEENRGKHIFIIKGRRLESVLDFLSFSEIPVKIIY